MKKIFFVLTMGVLLIIGGKVSASGLADTLRGRILLQVQANGEAWYVNPANSQRYYLGRPADAFALMRSLGLGIKNSELASYLKSSFPSRLSGRILLDVEKNGEAYYVYPVDLKGYYLGRPADAFALMRNLGLGITNSDLGLIAVASGNSSVGAIDDSAVEDFSFGIQGDSHPERPSTMFNSDLYKITLQNASQADLAFYFLLGDDFSIEKLIEDKNYTQQTVDAVYLNQKSYLDALSIPKYLVNGNHEQEAKYLLDGTNSNPAILARNARAEYFDSPGAETGYYSFTYGNALFVVIDFYWHSDVAADNTAGARSGEKRQQNLWNNTLGDEQYQWFKETLENSKAKYKFVFTHHVLGTGRGGVENAKLYEWGGYNKNGVWEFDKMRPNWELPIHQLMVKNGVTIFFQGHDHLFAKQELDGVVYQEVPNPADNTYTAFNEDAYKSGDTLSNSGFLDVTVSSGQVKVDYVRSFLPKDQTGQNENGEIAYSYTILK